ncbi:MAG: hypothetical protein ACE5KF_10540 [Kiloniellaceae bacterium]
MPVAEAPSLADALGGGIAALPGRPAAPPGDRVAVVVSGRNVEMDAFARVIGEDSGADGSGEEEQGHRLRTRRTPSCADASRPPKRRSR